MRRDEPFEWVWRKLKKWKTSRREQSWGRQENEPKFTNERNTTWMFSVDTGMTDRQTWRSTWGKIKGPASDAAPNQPRMHLTNREQHLQTSASAHLGQAVTGFTSFRRGRHAGIWGQGVKPGKQARSISQQRKQKIKRMNMKVLSKFFYQTSDCLKTKEFYDNGE